MKKALVIFIAFCLGAIIFSGPVEEVIECKYNEDDVESLLLVDNEIFVYAGEIIILFSDSVLAADVEEIESATQRILNITKQLDIKRIQRTELLEKMNL